MKTTNFKAKKFLERAIVYIRSNEELTEQEKETALLKSDKQIEHIMSDWSLFVQTFDILEEELKYHNLTKEEVKKEFEAK